jgi:hypothetical protein
MDRFSRDVLIDQHQRDLQIESEERRRASDTEHRGWLSAWLGKRLIALGEALMTRGRLEEGPVSIHDAGLMEAGFDAAAADHVPPCARSAASLTVIHGTLSPVAHASCRSMCPGGTR